MNNGGAYYSQGVWIWISWMNGKVSVGMGPEVGVNQLLGYELKDGDAKYEVGAVGFRTISTVGTWEFTKYESKKNQ